MHAEALRAGGLRRVAGGDVDLDAVGARHRAGDLADRAGADHRDAHPRLESGEVDRVHRDREGFHERRIPRIDPGGQLDDAPLVDQQLVGHAAVEAGAVEGRDAGGAQVLVATGAGPAPPARHERLDRHGPALVHGADLVTDRHLGRAEGEDVEVRSADPDGHGSDDDALPLGARHLQHAHALGGVPHGSHRRDPTEPHVRLQHDDGREVPAA